jgi:uncharacterized protein YneF (UPF0154 family)
MKTLLIAVCFAFALPTFASTHPQKQIVKKEIGDNPPIPQDPTKPKG